jgi:hypothetical protein
LGCVEERSASASTSGEESNCRHGELVMDPLSQAHERCYSEMIEEINRIEAGSECLQLVVLVRQRKWTLQKEGLELAKKLVVAKRTKLLASGP